MPDLESKEGERDKVPGQKAEEYAVSDIEDALNFLDSGEYQEVGHPTPKDKKQERATDKFPAEQTLIRRNR